MAELAKKDEPVAREVMPRDEAVTFFKSIGENYKAEIIALDPGERGRSRSTARATSIDLCRGPHVPSTGKLKVFKLMKVAGAYWRGDSQERDAPAHLRHRLGEEGGPGRLPARCSRRPRSATTASSARSSTCSTCRTRRRAWCSGIPKGWAIWQQVEQYMRRVYRDNGYQEVAGPQILDRSLWEKSGHWENYSDNMFTTESEKRDYALKPMNCPGHVQIFNQGLRSYRDLPLRYGEFGAVPPQRAVGRAARHHARARLHAGRRPHLLHRGADPAGVRRLHGAAAEGLPRLRLHRHHLQARDAARRSASAPTRSGTRPRTRCARRCARSRRRVRRSARARARSTARRSSTTLKDAHRPLVAVRHDAGRLQHARAAGRRVRRPRTTRATRR